MWSYGTKVNILIYWNIFNALKQIILFIGKWTVVTIDDYFPFKPLNPEKKDELLYASSGEQLWAPLIEKAAAKLYGSYESLGDGGTIPDGLT